MKVISKLFCLSMLLLAFASCDKDYDMPPLNEPKYEGAAANITIAQLKEKYKDATQNNALTIDEDLVLKAVIGGDDRSGNIYKQMYIQDETGGMSFQVDQGSVYNDYPQGQIIYINLKGLCVSVYGGEQQLGEANGYLYRTPYETFKTKVIKDGWPTDDNITIKEFSDISKLSDNASANAGTVVRLTGVHFENGGKGTFAPADGYGLENLKDVNGNTIVVRTSNYADFASNTLPAGTGNVVAVLGRFNSSWQLTIRNADDVYGFDGQQPGEGGGDKPTTGTYTLGEAVAPANITDGTYAIGYTYNGTLYLMKHEVFSNNYVAAVSYTSGSSVDSKSVYTVAKSGNGYTIKGADGTFLEATIKTSGEKTYTNLVPTGKGTETWTFTAPTESGVEANACKAEFASVSTERFMMFTYYASQNAAEFTMAYAGNDYSTGYYKYPVFYKLVEK